MLIPVVLTIIIAIKSGDIIIATTIGSVLGIATACIFGLFDFIQIDSASEKPAVLSVYGEGLDRVVDGVLYQGIAGDEYKRQLQTFIQRFSANKSKSKQATSRRKLLDKLTVEEMPASSRRYPFVGFTMDREPGKDILIVENISKTIDGVKVLDNISFLSLIHI